MRRTVDGWGLALALCLSVAPAAAQDDPPAPEAEAEAEAEAEDRAERPAETAGLPTMKEEIVVTATRLETPFEAVGSTVTVIGEDEIERRKETSVFELLRSVPGLEVVQSGGHGSLAHVFLRGSASNHALVLIDGIRVNGTADGAFDFATLRTDDVQRIEIVRGPQSTLYGSEAIGGVISITSRRGREGLHVAGDVSAGSLDTRHVRVAVDGGTPRWDYSLTVADRHTEGVSAASELRGNRETDDHSDLNLAARLGAGILGDGRVDLVMRHSDAETSLDGFTFGVGPTDDPNAVQQRETSLVSLRLDQPLTPRWDLHLTAGVVEDDLLGEDPDTELNRYDIDSSVRELSVQSDFEIDPRTTLVAGYVNERRTGTSRGSYDESFDVDSFYLESVWSPVERLHLTAGVRNDRYGSLGDETTYRATGSYLWRRSDLRLHGSYGTGFRVPSFVELFFPFAGNPDLRPETSTGYDLGIEKGFAEGTAAVSASLFRNRYEDLIEFDFVTFTFQNLLRAESEGVEVSLELQPLPALALRTSYTHLSAEDEATGERLARRPRHRWTLVALYDPPGPLSGTASLVGVDDRIDSDGMEMDSYQRLDLSAQYRVRPWLEPYVQIRNLLDEAYEEVPGFTTPGFTALAGLRVSRR